MARDDRVQANIRVKPEEAEAIMIAAYGRGARTFTEAAQEMIARGLCAVMAEQGVAPKWLARVKWPHATRVFMEYMDAVARKNGSESPLHCTHRLEPVPAGTKYAEPDRQVYFVLPDRFTVGPDGEPVSEDAVPSKTIADWAAILDRQEDAE
ncbi:MAG: hypothetical protein GX591_08190 [Planctomycetes bacterium]|nr:hypothetical protein [Planctomycetota bacterium]